MVIELRYRVNMKLIYGRLRHTGVVLVIMLAVFLVMWHNVDSYAAMFNKVVAEEKIDINTADKEELDDLLGIGSVLAQRIIDYRQQYGCFLDVYEIINIKGIGPKTFDGLRDLIDVTILPSPCNSSSIDCEASKNQIRENVEEIKKIMTDGEKGRITYAIAEVYVCCSPLDGHIETWVSEAGQGGNIRQEILDAAGTNAEEVAYPDLGNGMGDHAEMGLLRKAQMDQVRIVSIWATREICNDCENNLRKAGFNDDFVNPLCYVVSKVGQKGKLLALWSEIRNSIYR